MEGVHDIFLITVSNTDKTLMKLCQPSAQTYQELHEYSLIMNEPSSYGWPKEMSIVRKGCLEYTHWW